MAENIEPLSGCWEVCAGLIPGDPMPEFTKRFPYTSTLRVQDAANANDGRDTNNFTRLMLEAHDYAKQITVPQRVNWVRVDWIWF